MILHQLKIGGLNRYEAEFFTASRPNQYFQVQIEKNASLWDAVFVQTGQLIGSGPVIWQALWDAHSWLLSNFEDP